jgi:hypothetical protein
LRPIPDADDLLRVLQSGEILAGARLWSAKIPAAVLVSSDSIIMPSEMRKDLRQILRELRQTGRNEIGLF